MENLEELLKESKDIIQGLKPFKQEIQNMEITSQEIFRNNLMKFLSIQMNGVNNTQELLDIIDAEIIKKVLLHEVSIDDLKDLRHSIASHKLGQVSTLLEPFKPNNATGSTLLTPPIAENKENENIVKQLTSGQRQSLVKLASLLDQVLNKENNIKSVEKLEEDN